jgi:4-amino-4-deoxy-L-arabinose transferase-like glycosyltransferase
MEGHGGPFYLTFLYILLGLFPFSFFIPQAIIMRFKAGSTKNFYHFSLIIFITYLLFFSISSTKLPNYTMPSYVFLAILIAKIIVEDNMKNLKLFSIILISLVIGLIPFLFNYFLKTSENLSSLTFLSYFLFLPAFISFIALVLFFLKKKSWYFFTGLSTIVLFVLLHSYIFPQLNKNNPVSYINSKYENVDFVVYKRMDPAFLFNNKKIYKIFNDELNLITYLKLNPDTYVMTNIRNTKEIDSLDELKIVDFKKSLFEYHFTKIYKLK